MIWLNYLFHILWGSKMKPVLPSVSWASHSYSSTYSAKLGCCRSPCFPAQFLWKVKNIYIKLQKNWKNKIKLKTLFERHRRAYILSDITNSSYQELKFTDYNPERLYIKVCVLCCHHCAENVHINSQKHPQINQLGRFPPHSPSEL